jgi:hypothetical protein
MSTVAKETSTDLLVESIEFKEIPADVFDPRSLEKG